jgi:hypothetical protein
MSVAPLSSELSSDANIQAESTLGLTDSLTAYAAIAKSVRFASALMCCTGFMVYEIIPASSARFT